MHATDLVASAASTWVNGRFPHVSGADRSRLRELYRADLSAPDYDDVHAAFATEFLLVNFFKCAAVLDDARPAVSPVVVDIGCGSGAAAAAALAYLFDAGVPEVEVHLLDRSKPQLGLAEEFLRAVADRLGGERPFQVKISPTHGEWPTDRLPSIVSPAMVLASHVLTENQMHTADFLDRAVDLAGPSGTVTVVERATDQLWSMLDGHLAESVLVRRTGRRDVPAETANGDQRSWATRWLTLERSAHPQCEGAVRGYLTAWRKQDPDRLAAIFTEDALYWDKPFQPAIEGLTGIREYWRTEVTSRRAVTVAVESVAYRLDGAHLEWRAVLDHGSDTSKVVYGFMVLEVDQAGMIRELRECYRSREESRDPARTRPGDR
ncbi:nuclear transport factor 2 family protein [Actinoplanes sp. NPDC048796]|uniref:YybH family protein n=1 Tax=unclassified Actinoplanes TaxID=2626549 RepID=UPI0034067806